MTYAFIRAGAIMALVALALPQTALANTMTFDSLEDGAGPGTLQPYIEDGISATASGGTLGYMVPGSLHLDDSGTPFANRVSFTMAGLFDFISLDLLGLGSSYEIDGILSAYDNVLFEGFRGGLQVATLLFSTGTINPETFVITNASLGGGFVGLDEFRITNLQPTLIDDTHQCRDQPCGHVSVDNLTLSPVPVPAALPMLLGGIGLLGVIGLRRRRA